MGRYEALEDIRETWEDQSISLGEKILRITSVFSSEGLDLGSTAAHLHATPAELDALLSLGELDESVIERISQVNPPKTAWTMLANANEEEIEGALRFSFSEFNTTEEMDYVLGKLKSAVEGFRKLGSFR